MRSLKFSTKKATIQLSRCSKCLLSRMAVIGLRRHW